MDLLNTGRLALRLSLVVAIGWPTILPAQPAAEYEVKAAFLYKFASFVTWPDDAAGGPLCIGVAGQDPFGMALDDVVKGKSIGGRPFVVKRFKPGQESPDCHIVFISASEKKRLPTIFEHLRAGTVLTVGDIVGFCESGGIVNFEVSEDRVRLQINLQAAERARLLVSSKLLSVAKIVGQGPR
jgi:hypothetical protein